MAKLGTGVLASKTGAAKPFTLHQWLSGIQVSLNCSDSACPGVEIGVRAETAGAATGAETTSSLSQSGARFAFPLRLVAQPATTIMSRAATVFWGPNTATLCGTTAYTQAVSTHHHRSRDKRARSSFCFANLN